MIFLQLIFNSVASGFLLSLVAVGFNFIFNTTKVFHIAHGAIYICGAYALLLFLGMLHSTSILTWILAFLLAVIAVAVLSVLTEILVYRPLFKQNSGQAITLISSLGVYILLVNLTALCQGNESRFIRPDLGDSISLGPLVFMPIQFVQLGIGFLLLSIVFIFSRSKWFLQVRALMSNQTVAMVLGVNSKRIRMIMMLLGGLLAMIAAILRLYDTGIDPQAGMTITLSAVVAVIIGGTGSVGGTIIASLLIAFLQTIIEWSLSAQWKEGLTFLLLMAVMVYRTEGIVSFKMRVEEK